MQWVSFIKDDLERNAPCSFLKLISIVFWCVNGINSCFFMIFSKVMHNVIYDETCLCKCGPVYVCNLKHAHLLISVSHPLNVSPLIWLKESREQLPESCHPAQPAVTHTHTKLCTFAQYCCMSYLRGKNTQRAEQIWSATIFKNKVSTCKSM